MKEELFDLSEEYESMLNQGIRLSGENMMFFLEGRLKLLRKWLARSGPIGRILDFGCGLGYASRQLAQIFPGAQVVGVDTSVNALASARQFNGGPGIDFVPVRDLAANGYFDLCYVNGVFHHIAMDERGDVLRLIHDSLRLNGKLALFENNPWNPGARMVMARIPFDRDAVMLSPIEASLSLLRAEFDVVARDSLFFFPRFLKALRFSEPVLGWTQLGAQYMILGRKR